MGDGPTGPVGPLLDAVYGALDKSGHRWAVLRGGEESVARGGDVDILIDTNAMPQVQAALGDLEMAAVHSAGQGSHRFFVGFDALKNRWVRIDLTTRIEFGPRQEYVTDAGDQLLARRERVDGRWQLCGDDAFWHLLLHRFLGAGAVEPLPLSASAIHATGTGPLASLIDGLEVPGISAGRLLALVRSQSWAALEESRRELVASWRQSRPGSTAVRLSRSADRLRHAVGSLRRPSGIAITIIGPDGAGKTTLAEGLRQRLPFPSRYVYMGVWRAYPQDRWLRYVPGARLAMRMARLTYRSSEAWYHRIRGRIVLLDRFTYDVMLPSAHLDKRGKITAKLVRRICVEPELVIVLNAPAEVMWERKHEQGIEELERRRVTYLAIAETRDFSVVIDAQQSVDAVRHTAEQAISRRLRHHWELTH